MKLRSIAASAVALALSAVLLGAASAASAQTITDQTGGAHYNGYFVVAGSNSGQSFTVPAGVQSIQTVSIGIGRLGEPGPVKIRLRTFAAPGQIGASDIAATTVLTSAMYKETDQILLTIPGGYAVTAGERYIILIEDAPGGSNAVVALTDLDYSGGSFYAGLGLDTDRDARFRVTYQDVIAAPVPTLSEWAMIAMGLLLAGGAALFIQRRRLTA